MVCVAVYRWFSYFSTFSIFPYLSCFHFHIFSTVCLFFTYFSCFVRFLFISLPVATVAGYGSELWCVWGLSLANEGQVGDITLLIREAMNNNQRIISQRLLCLSSLQLVKMDNIKAVFFVCNLQGHKMRYYFPVTGGLVQVGVGWWCGEGDTI